MSSHDERADVITGRSTLHRVVGSVVGFIPAVARCAVRTVWTLVRIVAAVWTRRLPADDDLVSASWLLALLGVASPLMVEAIHLIYELTDPIPRGTTIDRLVRSQTYGSVVETGFIVFGVVSLAIGMCVSRRRPRVMWWVAPQMVVLVNVIGVLDLYLTVEMLIHFRIYLPNGVLVPLRFMPLIGAFVVTGAWMWWVITPTDTERLEKELAAEQAATESVKSTGP